MSSRICVQCRGNKFEEIDELLYCVRCKTQVYGYVKETTAVEDLLSSQIKKAVVVQKDRKVKRKERVLWNTYEAFNLILIEQCKFLINEVGLPHTLRDVVLAIWASFLQNFEMAFTPESPKLPAAAKLRDIVVFATDLDQMPYRAAKQNTSYHKRAKKGQSGSKGSNLTSFAVVETESESSSNEEDDRRYMKRVLGRFRVQDEPDTRIKATKQEDVPKRRKRNKDQEESSFEAVPLEVEIQEGNPSDLEISGMDTNYETTDPEATEIEEESFPTRRRRRGQAKTYEQKLEENRRKTEERLNILQQLKNLHEDMINSYSKKYIGLVGKPGNDHFNKAQCLDLVNLPTTVAIIYLSIRYLQLPVYLTDLLSWITQGLFPYFSVFRCLPKEWELDFNDKAIFIPSFPPPIDQLLKRAYNLSVSIGIPRISLTVDIFQVISHMLSELNLPQHLLSLVSTLEDLQKIRDFGDPKGLRTLPYYESTALMVIIVLLKKTFVLATCEETDGICNRIRQLPDFEEYFLFDEWRNFALVRLCLLKSLITPLHKRRESEMVDHKLVVDFYLERVHLWTADETSTYASNNDHACNDKSFRDELVNIIEELTKTSRKDKTRRKIWMEEAKPAWLSEATKFCKELVLNQIPDSNLARLLSQSFEDKKLSFVKNKSGFIVEFSSLKRPQKKGRKDRVWYKEMVDIQPPDILLLLEYCSLILHRDKYIVIQDLEAMEKKLFPKHYTPKALQKSLETCEAGPSKN